MDEFMGWVMGFIIFGLMGAGIVSIGAYATGSFNYQKVLAACEKELPRNQHCKLTAEPVPISGEQK